MNVFQKSFRNLSFPIFNSVTNFSRANKQKGHLISRILFSSHSQSDLCQINANGKKLLAPPVWLRHHCRCDKCYNPLTHQRVQIPSALKDVSQIISLQTIKGGDEKLQITWNDGHISEFSPYWLEKALTELSNAKPALQNDHHPDSTATDNIDDPLSLGIKYSDFINGDNEGTNKNTNAGLIQLLSNIRQYGYGLVIEAPADVQSTKEVILKVSHSQTTIFGDFYEFSSDLTHADTAYTSDYVHLHTDTTYFSEPIGLQVFHCLLHKGTGGLNSIVDGFKISREIKEERPEIYEILTNSVVPWQYVDPNKHHFYSTSPILRHDPLTRELECFRYNPHDMAVLDTIPVEELPRFYESLVYLSKKIEENPIWLKLNPGTILFLDNWRMLHGRNEFTGQRNMTGAYISRSDYLSQCRVLLSK